MRVEELFSSVRNTLQDHDKNHWDDSELLAYYNECKRTMAMDRLENKTTATLTLDPLINVYDTTGAVRYVRMKDDLDNKRPIYPNDLTGADDEYGVIIQDYNRVYVNDPSIGTSIIMDIVAMPSDDNLSSNIRIGDENSFKYYILSKAYEKDSDMNNFQKSDVFYTKFYREFKKLKDANSVGYTNAEIRTKSYFY